MSIVERTEQDGVVTVRLCDRAGGNRLTEEIVDGLVAELDRAAADPALRVLVLAGTPEVFCAGATLASLERIVAGDYAVADMVLPARIVSFPVPVIGAVAGHAVGGGLVLALCCDVTVASASSRYGVNFTDLGFTPGMGCTRLLPALVGHGLAMEMMAGGATLRGRELAGRGLFTHVVEAADVEGRALDLALRMADKPRHVLELLKDALGRPRRALLDLAMADEDRMHRICFAHPETGARVRARYTGGPEET